MITGGRRSAQVGRAWRVLNRTGRPVATPGRKGAGRRHRLGGLEVESCIPRPVPRTRPHSTTPLLAGKSRATGSILTPWAPTQEPHRVCSAARPRSSSSPFAEPTRPAHRCVTTARAWPATGSSPSAGARPDTTTGAPCTCVDAIASSSSAWESPPAPTYAATTDRSEYNDRVFADMGKGHAVEVGSGTRTAPPPPGRPDPTGHWASNPARSMSANRWW
jgi:hypothetical protein